MRFNARLSGGDDVDIMATTAGQAAAVIAKIRGVADLRITQTKGGNPGGPARADQYQSQTQALGGQAACVPGTPTSARNSEATSAY
jgi:hypothetical protein